MRIVGLEARRPRFELDVTGEDLRRQLEARLDARDPSEPAETAEAA